MTSSRRRRGRRGTGWPQPPYRRQKRTGDRPPVTWLPTAPLRAHLYPLNCGATLSTSRLITIGDTHENGGCDRIPSMSDPNAATESIHHIVMTWNTTPCNTMHPCNRRRATSSRDVSSRCSLRALPSGHNDATDTRRTVGGGLVTLRDACMQAVRGTPRVPSAGGAFAGTTGNRSIAVRHADAASSFRDAGACSCAACTERELAARRR